MYVCVGEYRDAASARLVIGAEEVEHSPQHITFTLHPTLYTLHPTPYTLHPTP